MRQAEVFPKYKEYSLALERLYGMMQENYEGDGTAELATLRGYVDSDQIEALRKWNIGRCYLGMADMGEFPKELGITSSGGNFLLNGRFTIPVYDVGNNLCSLIGYYPDSRKYITLPAPFFSKECQFFNFRRAYERSWSYFGGYCILVEGIFDCLSLDGLGLPCIATMGSTVSEVKGELLKLFSKVLAIPDDDDVGRKALNRYDKKGWRVPDNTTFLKFTGGTLDMGGTLLHCKDMDNFVSWYDRQDVFDTLMEFRDCKTEIEELKLG